MHETVDGEVIAIDLTSGSYYSLSGSGPKIWQMLGAGASPAEICATLERHFEAEPGVIAAAVTDLLVKLRDNGLITADGDFVQSPDEVGQENDLAREPFFPPVFERYTDMKDYFLLDPIHEVSPSGWPGKPGE